MNSNKISIPAERTHTISIPSERTQTTSIPAERTGKTAIPAEESGFHYNKNFCPECGNKYASPSTAYCPQCGHPRKVKKTW